MLLRVIEDGSTKSLLNASYDCYSSKFHIEFHAIWAETNPNVSLRFLVSWWNLDVLKFSAASLKPFVCDFGQYGLTWMSNMIFLCELTNVIPRLPCLFTMAKSVSSTVQLVNSLTFASGNLFYYAMWAFTSKRFPIELVPYYDGWQRSWWQTIHLIPGLPVCSMQQC